MAIGEIQVSNGGPTAVQCLGLR